MLCPNCNNENDDQAWQCAYCGMVFNQIPSQKKNYTKIIAIAGGIVVAIVCIFVGIFILNKKSKQTRYEEKIKMADKYFVELDYDSAIVAYNEALEINDEDEEVYIQLAIIYEATGDINGADQILAKGYQRTRSSRIRELRENLLKYGSIYEEMNHAASDSNSDKNGVITLNEDVLNNIINFGYQDFEQCYGSGVISRENGNDVISIYYDSADLKLIYVNGATDIFDRNTRIPYGNTKPTYIQIGQMSTLFTGFTDVISYDKICELFNSDIAIKNSQNRNYLDIFYNGCELQLECDVDGNINVASTWNNIVPPDAGKDSLDNTFDGTASGKIINASTGYGIPDVKLTFREGIDNQFGQVVAETKTDSQGEYSINLKEGKYTVCAEATGFTTEYFEINIVKGMTMSAQNFTMSNQLASGQTRIVLEWGATPSDLDSHLVTNNGEVSYQNMSISNVASLDVDDMTGYGPETITINDVSNGTYHFYVEDFTNSGNSSSSALGNSGATVKVYMSNESEPRVFHVPANAGYIWDVFTIENGQIKEINQVH